VRLYHGTDVASALDIQANGLDAGKAAAMNGIGDFWATCDPATADWFAQVNQAGGPPARLVFELLFGILMSLLTEVDPQVELDGTDVYHFHPSSYPVVNRHMANRQVISPVPRP
jgi:hypothetical protein